MDGLSPGERGSLLHDALFTLWGEIQNSGNLLALDRESRAEIIARSMQGACAQLRRRDPAPVTHALLDLEEQRLRQLLERWLELEAQRGEFEVIAREQPCELSIGGLKLTLRIDRVDKLANGQQLLIDYKSGNSEIRYWLGARPSEPQLPLYAQMLEGQLDAIAYGVINKRNLEFRGIGATEAAPGIRTAFDKLTQGDMEGVADWPSLLRHWQSVMGQLAREFVQGHAPVDPVEASRTCTYCGLQSLCRIQ